MSYDLDVYLKRSAMPCENPIGSSSAISPAATKKARCQTGETGIALKNHTHNDSFPSSLDAMPISCAANPAPSRCRLPNRSLAQQPTCPARPTLPHRQRAARQLLRSAWSPAPYCVHWLRLPERSCGCCRPGLWRHRQLAGPLRGRH